MNNWTEQGRADDYDCCNEAGLFSHVILLVISCELCVIIDQYIHNFYIRYKCCPNCWKAIRNLYFTLKTEPNICEIGMGMHVALRPSWLQFNLTAARQRVINLENWT